MISLPIVKNSKIKFIRKSKKGFSIRFYVKAYFENDRSGKPVQKQEWSMDKPK